METLLHNLSEVFAVSIIHSLWQCLLIWLVVRIILSGAINFSAAVKHNISVAALYYATLWFVYTLFDQASHYNWVISHSTNFTTQPHLPLITTLKHLASAGDRYEITIDKYLPYITTAYALGVTFHSLRLASAWIQLKQLKQSITSNIRLQAVVEKLSKEIHLKKKVLAGLSERIDVPCVAGYIKPMIMLPISMTTYLSAKEVEAILLHELSHVKRSDYLVNALQQIMSVLFFFNPFVYLINRLIDHYREDACDDMVVAQTSEPLVYAQALLKIEQNTTVHLPLALAATGKKYHLLTRIERIMKTKKPITNMRHLMAAVAILIASSLSVAWFNPAIGNGKLSVKSIKPAIRAMFASADTTPVVPKPPKINKHLPKPPKPPKGPRTSWNYNGGDYYDNGFRDPKLEAMGKEMETYGKEMEAHFNSSEYKKMQSDMERSGKYMEDYYNNPSYKKMQQDMEAYGKKMEEYYNSTAYKKTQSRMEEIGKQMEAYYNSPAMKKANADMERVGKEYAAAFNDNGQGEKLGKQMEEAGKKMSAYYESAEFKKLNAELEKKYGIPENHNYRDDKDGKYRQYEEELKQHTPAEVRDAQEQMKKLGNEMRNLYNSPDRKAKSALMRAMGDSMRLAYNNPKIKDLQIEMKNLGQQMRLNNDNPEMKQMRDNMRNLGDQMRNYNHDPQIKAAEEQMRAMGAKMRNYNQDPKLKELKGKMKELGAKMKEYTQTPEFKQKKADWEKTHPYGISAQDTTGKN
ncbi:M56 family metallopeptidase [Mucilaginibacter ginkgonis]|uniref:M48 family metalloprotease n=1 Tax=Mucilaginibacter ginkgonis TaxID=2682091 RepID=A0A6I4I372_9SPHI|nr:M56 family metallopeptidase [Mucilaginibacter ginkgonis]QQL49238.1 M48 family metalloprotease [Mucilaginibacter ginkgonis]